MRNYLTFDNKDSLDFGVYINGQGTFRAPARSYNVLNIPGRNGDLLGFGSKLENVEITYRAFIYTNFDANIAALRSFLLSHVGYFKLTDSYHPDEYRLAYYKGPFVPDVVANNGAGSFDLTFVCKPQRFLNSGEEVTTLTPSGAEQHTYQGEIVNFSTLAGDKITSARADFHPIQDLHGYDHPWPGGGGKNKWNPTTGGIAEGTYNGITYTKNNDGSYSFSGTATGSTWIDFGNITLPAGTWTASVTKTGSYTGAVSFGANNGAFITYPNLTTYPRTVTSESETTGKFGVNFANGTAITGTLTLWIQIESGSTATSWEPYENICPISGRTGLSVYRTGKNLFNPHLYEGIAYNPTAGTTVTPTDAAQQFTDNGSGVFTLTTSSTWRQYSILIPVVEGNNYHAKLSCSSSGQMGITRGYLDANHKVLEKINSTDTSQNYNYNMALPTGAAYFFMVITNRSTASATLTLTQPQFEIGSAATAYEPYQGNTYAVDWTTPAGTVYHGTVDPVAGQLTVDMASVDLGDTTWIVHSSGNVYAENFLIDWVANRPAISSQYVHVADDCIGVASVTRNGAFAFHPISSGGTKKTRIIIKDDSFIGYTAAQVQSALAGVQVVYELATPITYQLSAQEIEALADNYMWSDVGQVTVTVTDAMTIENPTLFDAKPLLRVYGAGTLTLGGQTITISTADVYTDIDCEMMDCFKDTVSKNGNVSFSGYDFPVIPPGRNVITMDGVTQVDITPRWWAA